jgi:ABC-type nitrate/sulfonate/bicarbonate transport system permease component
VTVAGRILPRVATAPGRLRFAAPAARLLPLAGPVLFIAFWWAVSASHVVRAVLLPPPFTTLAYLGTQLFTGTLGGDALITLSRTLIAFAIGAGLGVPLGVAFGSNERLYRSVEFLIDFFRSTPASALIPLFILFFGITDVNKIAIAGFSVFLIVMFNSAYGVMNARKSRILAAQVMGASRFAIFRDVLIFESLPQTFVGLRNGISTALVIVVVAEMFIGSDQGLGHRIIEGEQVLHVTDMYASIIVAGLLGYLLNVAFMVADKRLIHWNGK